MKYFPLFLMIFYSYFGFNQGRVDGFYKGKGNLDYGFSLGYDHNPNYFAGKTKIALKRDIFYANAFLVYGITNKFDVNLSLPFISVNGVENGIQDINFNFKYKFFEKVKSIKKQPSKLIKRELSISTGASSNITNYQTEGGNALGQQAKIFDLRLVYHKNYNNQNFLTVQSGYSFKLSPTPSSFPFAIKYGLTQSNYYADFWYEYQYSFGGLDYKGIPKPSTFKELGVNYHKIGATFYKPIKNNFGFFVGVSYIISGRNTSQGGGINAGLVLKHYKKTKE